MNLCADVLANGQIETAGNGISPIDIGLLSKLTMTGFSTHFNHRLRTELKHKYTDNTNAIIHQSLEQKLKYEHSIARTPMNSWWIPEDSKFKRKISSFYKFTFRSNVAFDR